MAPAAVISLSAGRRAGVAFRLLGDRQLTKLASKGDPRAFAAIYERYHQDLFRYCRSITGNADDASDALQSTMASALRWLPRERRPITLRPWLFRIAHNESVSLIRRRRPATELTEAAPATAPGPHGVAVMRERVTGLVASLRELPERQRGALVMRELNGLEYGEIASALGVSGPAARQAVYEARLALTELEEGRELDCDAVRRSISARDGRVLRGRRLRAHLRACGSCNDFSQQVDLRRSALSSFLPPLPAAAGAAILAGLVGGAGSAGVGAGVGAGAGVSVGAAAGAGSGGVMSFLTGGLSQTAGGSAIAKGAAAVAVAVVAGVGTVEVAKEADHGPSPRAGASAAAPGTHAAIPRTASRPAARRAPSAERRAPGHGQAGERARQRPATPRLPGKVSLPVARRPLRPDPDARVPDPQPVKLPSAPELPAAAPPSVAPAAPPATQPWQDRYQASVQQAQLGMQLGMQVYQGAMQVVQQVMTGLFPQSGSR